MVNDVSIVLSSNAASVSTRQVMTWVDKLLVTLDSAGC